MKPLDTITARIGKLLRLAGNNSSAAEAASAMAKAQQLAAEHGISLTEIPDGTDAGSGVTHSETKCRKDWSTRLSAGLVERHFGVKCQIMTWSRRSVIQIVGMPSQVEIATYVFTFVSRAMTSAWHRRVNRRLSDRESFLRGFAHAISDQLPAVFPQTSLIVSSKSYMDERLTPKGAIMREPPAMKNTLSVAATVAGHEAGRKTSIRPALRGTSQPLLNL